MPRKIKLTVEQMYPTKAAREIADAVVDGMSNDESMIAHIIAWEEAYFDAGGAIGQQ
jgi:hypothetical protein